MFRHVTLLLLCFGTLCASAPAAAVWGWLRNAAITELDDSDWAIIEPTGRRVFDTAADGERVDWRNDTTGNRGAFKPLMTFQHQGRTCRRMAFLIEARTGIRGVSTLNLCLGDDDSWRFVADSAFRS